MSRYADERYDKAVDDILTGDREAKGMFERFAERGNKTSAASTQQSTTAAGCNPVPPSRPLSGGLTKELESAPRPPAEER